MQAKESVHVVTILNHCKLDTFQAVQPFDPFLAQVR